MIRAEGGLVPLLDPRALVETANSRRPVHCVLPHWVVVFCGARGESGAPDRERLSFSVPVDEVGEVVELPTVGAEGGEKISVLDIQKLMTELN